MPHIILEYSNDVGESFSGSALLQRLHQALGETEGFETDRIKSRAIELATYRVGSDEGRGFVHATVIFSRGRSEAARRELGHRLLGILMEETGAARADVSRSVEIRQFESGMYFNDRDHSPGIGGLAR